MSGGLVQLVSIGSQDRYLTSDPSITFWKSVYRRHTNHAVESVRQTFSGEPGFGRRATASIGRHGDLVSDMYLEVTLPPMPNGTVSSGTGAGAWTGGTPAVGPGFYAYKSGDTPPFTGGSSNDEYYAYVSYVNQVGLALLRSVEIEIGGQTIDKNYGEFMALWNELAIPSGKKSGYDRMIGAYSREDETVTTFRGQTAPSTFGAHALNPLGGTYFVPLRFWFCGEPGSALPLVAMQYHEVKVHFEFRPLRELLRFKAGSDVDVSSPIDGWDIYHAGFTDVPGSIDADSHVKMTSCDLWVDYVYLDTEERKRFAAAEHEYLIHQVQFLRDETIEPGAGLVNSFMNFNHPVRALYWVITRSDTATANTDTGNQWFDFGYVDTGDADRVLEATVRMNGHERFATRKGMYFRLVQPYQRHTRVPDKQVYVYSFALHAEGNQPSGSCNFSRIDNSQLVLKVNPTALGNLAGVLKLYAVNYNVLRIVSGMCGVRFSN